MVADEYILVSEMEEAVLIYMEAIEESSCYIECKNIIIKSGSSVRRVLLILLFHRKFHFQCY